MSREALDLTPPPIASSQVSPVTYFGTRQREYGQAAASVNSSQDPHPELPQQYVQPPAYHPAPQQDHEPPVVAQFTRVLEARQRKLRIRLLDGKEL